MVKRSIAQKTSDALVECSRSKINFQTSASEVFCAILRFTISQIKTVEESLGSSPSKAKDPVSGVELEDITPSTGKKFALRVETPTLPPQGEPAFNHFGDDDLSAGNHNYIINRKERGLLGHFWDRERIVPTPVRIESDSIEFHTAINTTLYDYLENALRKKGIFNDGEIQVRARHCALILVDSCSIMTYLKVRNIIISEFQDDYDANSLKRSRVEHDHAVLIPFAFAIQQLGIVHAVDLEYEVKFAPVFPSVWHAFGLPTDRIWNSNSYFDAVAYARNLRMQFGIVDLKEKKGTAWWLLQPYSSVEDDLPLHPSYVALQTMYRREHSSDPSPVADLLVPPSLPSGNLTRTSLE